MLIPILIIALIVFIVSNIQKNTAKPLNYSKEGILQKYSIIINSFLKEGEQSKIVRQDVDCIVVENTYENSAELFIFSLVKDSLLIKWQCRKNLKIVHELRWNYYITDIQEQKVRKINYDIAYYYQQTKFKK